MSYARYEKPLSKKPPLDVAKKYMERTPHVMQQHENPRKGHSIINLHESINRKVILKK